MIDPHILLQLDTMTSLLHTQIAMIESLGVRMTDLEDRQSGVEQRLDVNSGFIL